MHTAHSQLGQTNGNDWALLQHLKLFQRFKVVIKTPIVVSKSQKAINRTNFIRL